MTDHGSIPLVDLSIQHNEIAEEVRNGWASVIERSAFILGEEVDLFEREFARFCGLNHCIGVGNGTDALELSLRAVGIGPGDEVILPTNSFAATAMAVVRAGATPVFADIDETSYLIDSAGVAERISSRTRAVIPVHLFGQMAPVEELAQVIDSDVVIVEDAAQAQGATRNGQGVGAISAIAATSFYPGKNLGAYGDAGAVVTISGALASLVRTLRNYGSKVKYFHEQFGANSRLDTLQAVVLRAKLRRLSMWNEQRRTAASYYDLLLADVPSVKTPRVHPGNVHVFHLYVVRLPDRERVVAHLGEAGIQVGIHYPRPLHLQKGFENLGYKEGACPRSERVAQEILSLPMFPGITRTQQERVVSVLKRALRDAA